uniref:Uncharacterized protein n=1 Tax=Mus musculus TaxID=10090 RepID=Q3US56_MOUSE|nr:unnamed protein product [Mus musculus]
MCEIDSLASTFVPNLCCGPKGFHFSLKLVFFFFLLLSFFILDEFCVGLNYSYAFIQLFWRLPGILYKQGFLFCCENGTFFSPVLCFPL